MTWKLGTTVQIGRRRDVTIPRLAALTVLTGAAVVAAILTMTAPGPSGNDIAAANAPATPRPAVVLTAAGDVVVYRRALSNIASATERHDSRSVARFRAELARISTPAVLTAVSADQARLGADITAATTNHDYRTLAAFRDQLTVYSR